jgi:hypothetical protein
MTRFFAHVVRVVLERTAAKFVTGDGVFLLVLSRSNVYWVQFFDVASQLERMPCFLRHLCYLVVGYGSFGALRSDPALGIPTNTPEFLQALPSSTERILVRADFCFRPAPKF